MAVFDLSNLFIFGELALKSNICIVHQGSSGCGQLAAVLCRSGSQLLRHHAAVIPAGQRDAQHTCGCQKFLPRV